MLRKQWLKAKGASRLAMTSRSCHGPSSRWFSESRRLMAIKPVLLADIGEGVYIYT